MLSFFNVYFRIINNIKKYLLFYTIINKIISDLIGAFIMKIKSTVLGLTLLCSGVANADFQGKIVDVLDGGRVVVYTDGRNEVVKLRSIITPFPNQNLYSQSRSVFERVMLDRDVVVKTENSLDDTCIHGELISNGINLNEALLMTGFAWIFNEAEATPSYLNIEERNKMNVVGLWKPEYHFTFNDISLPASQMVSSCITTAVFNTPEEEQIAFAKDNSKYNFLTTLQLIIFGILLGLFLWWGVHKFDNAGFDLLKHFRKKPKKDDDLDILP